MAKTLLGIEIGNFTLKIAECCEGKVQKMAVAELPDNYVRDGEIISWEAMAEFLQETIKKEHFTCKRAAFILPENKVYIRRVTLPAMTVAQLKVNLPYEFHDFITEDKDKYFYDYSVIEMREDEEGKPKEMELLAAATKKSTIEKYRTMCKRAGLRLTIAAPEALALQYIVHHYIEQMQKLKEDEKEVPKTNPNYALLDLGHGFCRINIFTSGDYDVSRSMDPGLNALTQVIVEKQEVDPHIAEIYKAQNQGDILTCEESERLYNHIAVEIMRVINFYSFNQPTSALDKIYYYGGGAHIKPLLDEIQEVIEPKLVPIAELFTEHTGEYEDLMAAPAAIGITMEE